MWRVAPESDGAERVHPGRVMEVWRVGGLLQRVMEQRVSIQGELWRCGGLLQRVMGWRSGPIDFNNDQTDAK